MPFTPEEGPKSNANGFVRKKQGSFQPLNQVEIEIKGRAEQGEATTFYFDAQASAMTSFFVA